MPLALLLISTWVTGWILPVATTDRARSMRSTLAIFSGSIFSGLLESALTETIAAPPSTIRTTAIQMKRLRFFDAINCLIFQATGRFHSDIERRRRCDRSAKRTVNFRRPTEMVRRQDTGQK